MSRGVAISTTGDDHRLGFLETCVKAWDRVLGWGDSLFVTVDGDETAARHAAEVVRDVTESVYRVGQRALDPRHHPDTWYAPETGERLGVAVNKNTGLELLMDNTKVEHLFLCDDDTWPVRPGALDKHIELAEKGKVPHSLVCWGRSRIKATRNTHDMNIPSYAMWTWPRGVMLYTSRWVVEGIGGMDERFGPGGHEHVEWSRRIHQAGLTPDPFVSPLVYAERGPGGPARRAEVFWHAEDMPRRGEPGGTTTSRRRRTTTIRRKGSDWDQINQIMTERDGDTSFVPYRAQENGRQSATLCSSSTCAVEPETPRSAK